VRYYDTTLRSTKNTEPYTHDFLHAQGYTNKSQNLSQSPSGELVKERYVHIRPQHNIRTNTSQVGKDNGSQRTSAYFLPERLSRGGFAGAGTKQRFERPESKVILKESNLHKKAHAYALGR
jgi:hypothetical protein